MTAKPNVAQDGFIAVPIWQQWASKG